MRSLDVRALLVVSLLSGGCHILASDLPCTADAQCPPQLPTCAEGKCAATGEGEGEGEGEGGTEGEGEGEGGAEGEGEGEGEGGGQPPVSTDVTSLDPTRSFTGVVLDDGTPCSAAADELGVLDTHCIRTALHLVVPLTDVTDCDRVLNGTAAVSDSLGAYDWGCFPDPRVGADPAARVLVSRGFLPGQGLRTLIDAPSGLWKTGTVSVTSIPAGTVRFTTAPGKRWFSNDVVRTASTALNQPDTVYVIDAAASGTLQVTAVGVAVLAARRTLLSGDGVFSASARTWIDASFVQAGTSGGTTGIHLTAPLSTVHGSTVRGFQTGISIGGGVSVIEESNVEGSDVGADIADGRNLVRDVAIAGTLSHGLLARSAHAVIRGVMVTGNAAGRPLGSAAVEVTGATDVTLSQILAVQNAREGINLGFNSARAVLIGATTANNGGPGLVLSDTATGAAAFVAQLASVNNPTALTVDSAGDNTLVDVILASDDGEEAVVSAPGAHVTWPASVVRVHGICTNAGAVGFGIDCSGNSSVPLDAGALDATFVGATSDSINPTQPVHGSPTVPFTSIANRTAFENAFRAFSPATGAPHARGPCTGGNCTLLDWRLTSTDTVARRTSTDFTHPTIVVAFTDRPVMRFAMELSGELGAGEGDGTCDVDAPPADLCRGMPNLGAYQGEGTQSFVTPADGTGTYVMKVFDQNGAP